MLRLVERVMGEGMLVRAGERVLQVSYELTRYHEFAVRGGDMVPTGEVVEGHLHAPSDALEPLLGTSATLTLHLDDGRRFDLFVVNAEGVVTPADTRGFYST